MAKRAIRPIRIEGNIAYVPLTKGYEAIIDAEDVPLIRDRAWRAQVARRPDGSVRTVYAIGGRIANGGSAFVRMHRVLATCAPSEEVDHRDGDGLNNRKSNLRRASRPQNQQNSRLRIDNKSGFKGVRWDKSQNRWISSITAFGKRRHLGCFLSLEDAAAAYERASHDLHQEFARAALAEVQADARREGGE